MGRGRERKRRRLRASAPREGLMGTGPANETRDEWCIRSRRERAGIGRRLAGQRMSAMKRARLARQIADTLGMDPDKLAAMGDEALLGLRAEAKEARRPEYLSGDDIWEIMGWFGYR